WTDRPSDHLELRVDLSAPAGLAKPLDAWTVLGGVTAETTFPFRHAHLEQSRWLARWSELLVAAWDGKPAGGPGGTADTVALAIAAQQPVLWIDTSAEHLPIRLIRPEEFWRDSSFGEVLLSLHAPRDAQSPAALTDEL